MSSAMDTARTDVSGLDECKVFFSPDFGLAMEVIQSIKDLCATGRCQWFGRV